MVTIVKNATILSEDYSTVINVRADLEWAYSQQKARVYKLLAAEGNGYNPEIRQERRLEADLRKQLTDLYFALGTMKKAPRTTTVNGNGATTTIESEGRTHVMLNIRRTELLEQAEKEFMALLEEVPDSKLH